MTVLTSLKAGTAILNFHYKAKSSARAERGIMGEMAIDLAPVFSDFKYRLQYILLGIETSLLVHVCVCVR